MDKRLFLLDAYALIFRAYYALIRNPRITSKGKNTNAQFGFTNTIIDLINNQKPTHMAVCFDTAAPTERHTDFEQYKAHRQEAPEDLKEAIPDIKRIIRALNVPIMEKDGFEADDVIGTLSKQAEKLGYEVYMVTPDKDYGQLVSEKVKIYKPGYQGGDVEIMGPKEVCDKWCIESVDQVIDILGLMGDAVDNIPGIAGVGQKTACKLLTEYKTLENVIANADTIKGALGEKIRAGREDAIISKKLATIITNVPVAFHEEDFLIKEWNKEALKEVFTDLEFKTVIKRLLGEDAVGPVEGRQAASGVQADLFNSPEANEPPVEPSVIQPQKTAANTPHEYELVESEGEFAALISALKENTEISFDTETTGIDANEADLVGLSFAVKPHHGWYVPVPTGNKEGTKAVLARFADLFNDPEKVWIGQNIKYDLLMLKWHDVAIKGKLFDTMLAHYLIEPDGKSNMDWLSAKYLNYEPIHIEELIGKKGKNQGNMRDVELEKIKEYAVEDADVTLQFKSIFLPKLDKLQVKKVFDEIENPLVPVLVDMEYEGVRIDTDFLNEYSKVLDIEARVHEEAVYEAAGVRFNLGSPKQLGEVLFEKLKLDPKAKKTKTGQYATGEDVLRKLAGENPVADNILAYREYTKLKSTYVDALPLLINSRTGRVHTNYGQAIAVTGRLSSNNPNLQNIPIRT
ncbi:MAG: DNA polymerase, partial [Flavisolibacter sp.]